MSVVDQNMSIQQLLQVVADHHHKRKELSEDDKKSAIALLKKRGAEELDFGEEIEMDSVRLIKRVTGAVGVYFS